MNLTKTQIRNACKRYAITRAEFQRRAEKEGAMIMDDKSVVLLETWLEARMTSVYQDGACFYFDGRHIVAPFRVTDYDMEAAEKAREWFKDYCADNGITPRFEGE